MLPKTAKDQLYKLGAKLLWPPDLDSGSLDEILASSPSLSRKGKTIFATGPGRSGMRWFTKVLTNHSNCFGGAERFREAEAYFRYATWHRLQVNHDAFFHLLRCGINFDWNRGATFSLNASPYFSHGLDLLIEAFSPDFLIVHLRDPIRIVNSMVHKGWYSNTPELRRSNSLPGLQLDHVSSANFHRNFSRVIPCGDEFFRWRELSAVGRCAWFCSELASALSKTLTSFPPERTVYLRLEDIDQNFENYHRIATFFGLSPLMTRKTFLSLKGQMRNRGTIVRNFSAWSDKEKHDYESEIARYITLYDSAPNTIFD